MRFSIRSILTSTLVVAILLAWWLDRRSLAGRLAKTEADLKASDGFAGYLQGLVARSRPPTEAAAALEGYELEPDAAPPAPGLP
jgi:hypothetical protein